MATLVFAVIWFNLPEPKPQAGQAAVGTNITTEGGASAGADTATEADEENSESGTSVGHEIGQQLPDFTITCYDGTQFHLEDTRGKVIYNEVKSVTPDMLESLFREASQS